MNCLRQIIRDCRMAIAETYFCDGPEAALIAVADASLSLAPLVAEGQLLTAAAWDSLQEVSENLRLVELFGQDAVQHAIAFGPTVYERARSAAATGVAA